jgi:hypothetical protein
MLVHFSIPSGTQNRTIYPEPQIFQTLKSISQKTKFDIHTIHT